MEAGYGQWLSRVAAPQLAALADRAREQCKSGGPLVSVVMPVYRPRAGHLLAAVESVIAQSYRHWQLCIYDDGSLCPELTALLQRLQQRDARIVVSGAGENRGIAAATNAALELAAGDWVALMDQDDLLAADALLLVAGAARSRADAGLIYTDSDRLNEDGQRTAPLFKPDWNYDLLLAVNYLNHLTVYRRDHLQAVGGLREGLEGSQDYDLALRVVSRLAPDAIVHVPAILYHWRQHPDSTSARRLGEAVQAGRRAVREHLAAAGSEAQVKPNPEALIYNRILWSDEVATGDLVVVIYGEDGVECRFSGNAFREHREATGGAFAIRLLDCAQPTPASILDCTDGERASCVCLVPAGLFPDPAFRFPALLAALSREELSAVGAALFDSLGRLLPPRREPDVPGHLLQATRAVLHTCDQQVPDLGNGSLMVRREDLARLASSGAGAPPDVRSIARWLCRRLPGSTLWVRHAVLHSRSRATDAVIRGESAPPGEGRA